MSLPSRWLTFFSHTVVPRDLLALPLSSDLFGPTTPMDFPLQLRACERRTWIRW